jgi:hypothetical protein
MVRQYGNILATLAQRRQRDEGDIQAIVEVFAETTLADGLHQVHVGGGDHPHVHLNGLARADAGDFALLQHAQQFDLKRQAKLADFIEQQGAALRRLEPAGMALYRAGKRPFSWPNSSASARLSLSAPQLTARNGWRRGLW